MMLCQGSARSAFLEAKVQPPATMSGRFGRQRLIDRVCSICGGDCVILVAPEGSGKTNLVGLAVNAMVQRPGFARALWLHLDPSDNPETFWRYLAHALAPSLSAAAAPACPAYGEISRASCSGAPSCKDPSIATDFALAGIDAERDGLVIVIEDLHHLRPDDWDATMGLLLSRMPATCCVIATSRSADHIGAEGSKTRWLSKDDLFFTEGEVAELLAATATHPLDAQVLHDAAASVFHNTQGWPLVVQYAAGSIAAAHDSQEATAALQKALASVADYCVEEALASLPDDLQSFVTSTITLPALDPAECNRLTGCDDAAGKITRLLRETALVYQDSRGNCHYLPALRHGIAGSAPSTLIRTSSQRPHTQQPPKPRQANVQAGIPLSKRERTVLALLANGKSVNDIAEETFTSALTVRTHLKSIYRKLGVHSKTEAIRKAVLLGLD